MNGDSIKVTREKGFCLDMISAIVSRTISDLTISIGIQIFCLSLGKKGGRQSVSLIDGVKTDSEAIDTTPMFPSKFLKAVANPNAEVFFVTKGERETWKRMFITFLTS